METMDDRLKKLGFKDFITVDYTMTGDEYLAYQAQKRRRGHYDTWGDDYTPEGEQLDEGMQGTGHVVAVKDPKGWKVTFVGSKKDQSKEIKKMKASGKVIGKDFAGYLSPGRKVGDIIKEAVMKFLIGTMMLVWVLTMLGLWFINA